MQNPFSRDQIKNYLFFYAGIIAIIILFYILNTYLNPIQVHEQKVFDSNTTMIPVTEEAPEENKPEIEEKNTIRLLDKAY